MTIGMPFLDRIKLLSRRFIKGGANPALKRSPSHEIDILPLLSNRQSTQSPLSNALAGKPETPVATREVAGKGGRRWLANQDGDRDVEHTNSNLG